jgi:hypothetical protein
MGAESLVGRCFGRSSGEAPGSVASSRNMGIFVLRFLFVLWFGDVQTVGDGVPAGPLHSERSGLG